MNGENNQINNENNLNIQEEQIKQSDEEMTKAQKTLHNDFLLLFFLELIILAYTLTAGDKNINIFNVVYLVLTIIGFGLTFSNSKNSWIVGIIIGLSMMLSIISFDIIDAVLGLFIVIHSIMCIIEIKKGKTT